MWISKNHDLSGSASRILEIISLFLRISANLNAPRAYDNRNARVLSAASTQNNQASRDCAVQIAFPFLRCFPSVTSERRIVLQTDNTPKFRFGRVSQARYVAFSPYQLMIYETMTAPLIKEGVIVGWSDDIEAFFGRRPDEYVAVCSESAANERGYFLDWDAFIMSGEPSSEVPIEGLSAMLFGALLVVDDIPAWRNLVEDGVTGWLCRNEREFVYKASRCAHENKERESMITSARKRVLNEFRDHPHMRALVYDQKGCCLCGQQECSNCHLLSPKSRKGTS